MSKVLLALLVEQPDAVRNPQALKKKRVTTAKNLTVLYF